MSRSRVEVVLVRLCAVIIVVLTLQALTSYAAYFMAGEQALELTLLAFVFVFAIPIGIAVVLWYIPTTVVRTDLNEPGTAIPAEPDVGIFVGITLIGLYTLVFGLIDLFYYEAVRLAESDLLNQEGYGSIQFTPDTIAGRYTNIFQIVLGTSILLGRHGLSRLLATIRGRGGIAS